MNLLITDDFIKQRCFWIVVCLVLASCVRQILVLWLQPRNRRARCECEAGVNVFSPSRSMKVNLSFWSRYISACFEVVGSLGFLRKMRLAWHGIFYIFLICNQCMSSIDNLSLSSAEHVVKAWCKRPVVSTRKYQYIYRSITRSCGTCHTHVD